MEAKRKECELKLQIVRNVLDDYAKLQAEIDKNVKLVQDRLWQEVSQLNFINHIQGTRSDLTDFEQVAVLEGLNQKFNQVPLTKLCELDCDLNSLYVKKQDDCAVVDATAKMIFDVFVRE
jgi:hypothetical protein